MISSESACSAVFLHVLNFEVELVLYHVKLLRFFLGLDLDEDHSVLQQQIDLEKELFRELIARLLLDKKCELTDAVGTEESSKLIAEGWQADRDQIRLLG